MDRAYRSSGFSRLQTMALAMHAGIISKPKGAEDYTAIRLTARSSHQPPGASKPHDCAGDPHAEPDLAAGASLVGIVADLHRRVGCRGALSGCAMARIARSAPDYFGADRLFGID